MINLQNNVTLSPSGAKISQRSEVSGQSLLLSSRSSVSVFIILYKIFNIQYSILRHCHAEPEQSEEKSKRLAKE